jgi:type IV pilus assembly protein PilY1
MATTTLPNVPRFYRRLIQLLVLAGIGVGVSLVIGQTTSPGPLVDLATEPLYMNGAKAKGNLSIALSVEYPTVGQTYRDTTFNPAFEYIGYFDPNVCYRQVPGGNYFDLANGGNKPTDPSGCGGGGFSGNFMNWATSSAIDIMRYGLTGGNRVVDEPGGNGLTILERAWLPDFFYRSSAYFSEKSVPNSVASKVIETSLYNKLNGNTLYIYNCRNRIYFAKSRDTNDDSTCDRPFGTSATSSSHPALIGPTSNLNFYEVRNRVCDPDTATNRLMTYDPETKQWKGLCYRYPNNYKPVGQFQMNSESLRVSVFGYVNEDEKTRYGGVLRSPMKYLGPRAFDANFNLISGPNPRAEWDATTGVFVQDPQGASGDYPNQGYSKSGAIMYINKFGTLNPDAIGDYKKYDPLSELYYEVIRYLQGKQPTSQAISGLNGSSGSDSRKLTENYPVYTRWPGCCFAGNWALHRSNPGSR